MKRLPLSKKTSSILKQGVGALVATMIVFDIIFGVFFLAGFVCIIVGSLVADLWRYVVPSKPKKEKIVVLSDQYTPTPQEFELLSSSETQKLAHIALQRELLEERKYYVVS